MATGDSDFLWNEQRKEGFQAEVEERRIIILGKVGAGKSAIGNAILGDNAFKSRQSLVSVTRECAYKIAKKNGTKIIVYDTPGTQGLDEDRKSAAEHLKRCLYVTSPGFHIIVFAISAVCRLNEDDLSMFKYFQELLGKRVFQYSIIVFTRVDPDELEDLIQESDEMKGICADCGNRYLSFGNDKNVKKELVDEFEKKVEAIISKNSSCPYYTHSFYKQAKKIITRDAEELKKNNGSLSTEESVQQAIKNAFEGRSPRDIKLLRLTKSCCNIL